MTKNPFYNASAAFLYILGVAGIIYTLTRTMNDKPDNNFLIPVCMLSLLVLSVAIMSYFIFYQPLVLLLNKNQTQALKLFTQTLVIFFIYTIFALSSLILLT